MEFDDQDLSELDGLGSQSKPKKKKSTPPPLPQKPYKHKPLNIAITAVILFFLAIVFVVDRWRSSANEPISTGQRVVLSSSGNIYEQAMSITLRCLKKHGFNDLQSDSKIIVEDDIAEIRGYGKLRSGKLMNVIVMSHVVTFKNERHWQIFYVEAGGKVLESAPLTDVSSVQKHPE